MNGPNERLLSYQDVINAVVEHLGALDKLWPDDERYGPRKVHIVELIDGIKLRLAQTAKKNADAGKNAFEQAAERIVGNPPSPAAIAAERLMSPPSPQDVPRMSPMEEAARAAKARMAKHRDP